jgi:Type II secretory pathway, pullulanase PulA and related glycosidases
MIDEVLYEIYVRDFSIVDDSCSPVARGGYLGLVHEGM